jgi:hypothetical protein
VFECDREASIMRRPRPTRGCCAVEKKMAISGLPVFLIFINIDSCLCVINQPTNYTML